MWYVEDILRAERDVLQHSQLCDAHGRPFGGGEPGLLG